MVCRPDWPVGGQFTRDDEIASQIALLNGIVGMPFFGHATAIYTLRFVGPIGWSEADLHAMIWLPDSVA